MNSSDIFVFLFLIVTALVADGRMYRQPQKHMPKQLQEEFIVSGEELNITSVPYQCALAVYDDGIRTSGYPDFHTGCGCSIIHPWFVLTAAHCFNWLKNISYVVPNERFWIEVSAGANDKFGAYKWNTYYAINLAVHREYVFFEGNTPPIADIAIVMVNRAITFIHKGFNHYISNIPLVDSNKYIGGELDVYVSGYGRTVAPPEQDTNTKLFGLFFKTVDLEECLDTWEHKFVGKDYVCAQSHIDYLQSPCMGDSGGPLVSYEPGQPMVLVGVVSYVWKVCDGNVPILFTNVYQYRDWIYRKMKRMYQRLHTPLLVPPAPAPAPPITAPGSFN